MHAVDFVQIFLEILVGVFSAILRVLMAFGALFVAMLRIDRSLFPKWIDDVLVLDGMVKAYRSLLVIYHHHNNPSVHVFLRLLADAAAQRKAEPVDSVRRLLAANRWRKYAFMVLNPSVAVYKAKYEPKPMKGKKGQVAPAQKAPSTQGLGEKDAK